MKEPKNDLGIRRWGFGMAVVTALVLAPGCADEGPSPDAQPQPEVSRGAPDTVPGLLLVRLRAPQASRPQGGVVGHAPPPGDPRTIAAALGGQYDGPAYNIDYTFRAAAKRAFGFQRWHRIVFANDADISALAEAARARSDVDDALPEVLGRPAGIPPSDTYYASNQWNLENTAANPGTPGADIDAERGWTVTTGSAAVTLAILDTGIDQDHPEFAGRLVAGYDTIDEDDDPEDVGGHGTACAGIAAANGDNAFGIAGVDWQASIMPIRVLGPETGTTTDLIEGLIWAADNGADVVSLSLQNFSCTYQPLGDALQYARDAGVVLVSAAGNYGVGHADTSGPGCWPQTISVGATTMDGPRAGFSATGAALSLMAPGSSVPTVVNGSSNDGYALFGGTSAACPAVAAAAALMLSVDPTLDHDAIEAILELSADDQIGPRSVDPAGRDDSYGWGRLNLGDALEALPLGPLSLGRGPVSVFLAEAVTFYVVVSDANGQPPSAIDVVISGPGSATVPMSLASSGPASFTDSDHTNGELYTATTTLGAPGSYSYHFEATIDGVPERDPAVGEYDDLTVEPIIEEVIPAAEVATASSVVSGSLADLLSPDGVSYELSEVLSSGGNPANRTSMLEHTFELDVAGGAGVELVFSAKRGSAAPGADYFDLAVSTDGVTFVPAHKVTSTAFPTTPNVLPLPPSTSGSVYVRFTDDDRTPGSQLLDTLVIDTLMIRSYSEVTSCTGPPTVDFSATATSGPVPLTLAIINQLTDTLALRLDFGDGEIAAAAGYGTPLTNSAYFKLYESAGTYTVTLTGINHCGEQSETKVDYIQVTAPVVRVEAITVDRVPSGGGNFQGRALVTVTDSSGQPVASATITADYTGPTSGTASATTDAAGIAELKSKKTKTDLGATWCFDVTGINAPNHAYDPAQNIISGGCE